MDDPPKRRLDPPEIAACVERARAGEPAAFEALVKEFERMAWSVAYSVLGNAEAAGEAAQEGWFEAYRNLARLRDPARFGAWLARIVRFRACSARADRWRKALSLSLVGSGLPEPAAKEASCEASEAGIWARRAVEALPARYREVFLLRHVDGREAAEIAALLGLTVKGVNTRLRRAREMLLSRWDREGGGA